MTISVKYVDHLGNDLLVANAARRSFGAGFAEFRSRTDGPRVPGGRSDEELIESLAEDGHFLPFRHPHLIVECCAPLPVARQLGKHQVGLDWSEVSRRYKVKGIEFHLINQWRADVKDRRQGSGDPLPSDLQERLTAIQMRNIESCQRDYQEALEMGASPEQARFLLPQSMNVMWTWTGSLLAFAHLYKQRTHKDAQAESRWFAESLGDICKQYFPHSWRSLTK